MTKAELRREMRQHLQNLGPGRAEKSRAICEAISAHPAFSQGQRVAIFSPLPSEPDLNALWGHGPRAFCYPRVTREQMEFVEVATLDALAPAAWNPWIREPALTETRRVTPAEIDLILVPGLAFTRDGWRLGRGGGFYDRFLAQLPARAVNLGVCFEVQIVETLPVEAHDHRLDLIVTENGFVAPSH
jgi:5-formyltetrahydrofolate cyclo-ligase